MKHVSRRRDCCYTKEKTALSCLDFLEKIADVQAHDLWLEPSAGGGAFLRHLPKPKIGLDISPAAPDILQKDFLQWHPAPNNQNIIVAGNPPFGKNASLAVRFFNHASTFARRIAMIFPRTFRKDSIINRLHRYFHLDGEMLLPENSFELEGRSYSVPAVFQVWSLQNTQRALRRRPQTHPHFDFVPQAVAEFAIQRVGFHAGKIKQNTRAVSPRSHYFLKARAAGAFGVLDTIDWSVAKHDTAGNPSLSKADIVCLYARGIASGDIHNIATQ